MIKTIEAKRMWESAVGRKIGGTTFYRILNDYEAKGLIVWQKGKIDPEKWRQVIDQFAVKSNG